MIAQVFPAEPYNAEIDRLEDQGRGGWKGTQAKPALLPKDVEKGSTAFRCHPRLIDTLDQQQAAYHTSYQACTLHFQAFKFVTNDQQYTDDHTLASPDVKHTLGI